MKRVIKISVIILALLITTIMPDYVYADTENFDHYTIYNEVGEYLFEKTGVEVGDYYISNKYQKYEVISIDDTTGTGVAKFLYTIEKPKVNFNPYANPISTNTNKVICMYMTHNDESYVPTDGTESVYGAGGIHDVAKHFANALESYGITTHVNETLHIPHDTSAYSRSSLTAKKLIQDYEPNAIFDIHRDGASRAYYINKDSNGRENCMVRMVVGKANSSMEINEQFAIYLMAVADEISPGLFKDIYYAKGHYNQALHPKALLFEFGSHMVEKSLAMSASDKLAKVVNTALFNTTVDNESGEISINNSPTESTPTINDALDTSYDNISKSNANIILRILILAIGVAITIWIVSKILKKYNADE